MTDPAAPFVRDDVRGFLAYLAEASGGRTSADGTPEEARAMMAAMRHLAEAEPVELARKVDLSCPGPAGAIPLRLYDRRETREAGPLVLFLHGGGFVIGTLDSHDSFAALLAHRLDLPVLSVDYRLAPEHPFPAAPDDCEAAARWAADSPAELGFAVTGLVPCGDSAGGNLAIVTTHALLDRPAAAPVVAMAPIYPVVDTSRRWPSMEMFGDGYLLTAATMAWFEGHYAAPDGDPRKNVLDRVTGDLPPTALMTASLDPLRDQGRAYRDALETAGVPVRFHEAEGQIHGFITIRKAMPSGQADCETFIEMLRELLETAR